MMVSEDTIEGKNPDAVYKTGGAHGAMENYS